MVTTTNPIYAIEKIEEKKYKDTQVRRKLIGRISKAKNVRAYIKAQLEIIRKDKIEMTNAEVIMFVEELIRRCDELEGEKIKARIDLVGWKGSDRIDIFEKPNEFQIITHIRPDQDTEVKEVSHIISKEEINFVIMAINRCGKKLDKENKEYCETPQIAREYCILSNNLEDLDGNKLFSEGKFLWNIFFSCRMLHIRLNLVLRVLDKLAIIKYRGKRSWILKKDFKYQVRLK